MCVLALVVIHIEFKTVTAVSGPVAARSKGPSSPSITYYMQYTRIFFGGGVGSNPG